MTNLASLRSTIRLARSICTLLDAGLTSDDIVADLSEDIKGGVRDLITSIKLDAAALGCSCLDAHLRSIPTAFRPLLK
jgi:hypothetical protein